MIELQLWSSYSDNTCSGLGTVLTQIKSTNKNTSYEEILWEANGPKLQHIKTIKKLSHIFDVPVIRVAMFRGSSDSFLCGDFRHDGS